MSLQDIVLRMNGEIAYFEEQKKESTKLVVSVLKRYRILILQEQKFIEEKCQEMAKILRGI